MGAILIYQSWSSLYYFVGEDLSLFAAIFLDTSNRSRLIVRCCGALQHNQSIIPIPHPVQNVYFSIIPNHDYVIKYRDSYVPTDKETVSNCREISEYKICSRNQPSIKLLDSEICEATLFKRHVNNKCKMSPFVLHRETFIPITNGYIVIPLEELDLNLFCENRLQTRKDF